MNFSLLFDAFAIFIVIICDCYSERIDSIEKTFYTIFCSFFCGALTTQLILDYLKRRALEKLFEDFCDGVF